MRLFVWWVRGEHVAMLGRAAANQLGISGVYHQPHVFLGDTPYAVLGIIDDVSRNADLLTSIVVPTTTAINQFRPQDERADLRRPIRQIRRFVG